MMPDAQGKELKLFATVAYITQDGRKRMVLWLMGERKDLD